MEIEKKESEKLKKISETTLVDQPESSGQSEEAESGQQRKCLRGN